jgi:hypothetical protein
VQHVFLYDNGSSDETPEVLEVFQNHGLVTVVDWPLPGSQVSAYNHALRLFGPNVDWLAFFDVDEFLVPLQDDDVPGVLARYPDAANVQVPRREFAFSGHRVPPAALTIEAYTHTANTADRDSGQGPKVKAIVQPRGVFAAEIHVATVADRFPEGLDSRGRPVPTRTVPGRQLGDVIQLNHYYTRSFEEFEAKRFRGSAAGRLPRPAIPFDIPTKEVDTSAHRFIERTQAMIERMRSLEPRPYVYGSQLAFPQFPVFDDLGRFAEFGIANMAAGLAEAGRGPAMRFTNLWPGVGFVCDLSDTGFQPDPAAFSGSAHGRALFEHMRARLEASLAGGVDGTIADLGLRRGTTVVGPAGWTLRPEGGVARLEAELSLDGRRRCASIGFVLGSPAPLRLRVHLAETGGAASDPTVIDLPASDALAGVVEVASRPLALAACTIEIESDAAEMILADLFVVTYG